MTMSDTGGTKKLKKKPSKKKMASPEKNTDPNAAVTDEMVCQSKIDSLHNLRPCRTGLCNLEIIERLPSHDSGKPPVIFIHGAFIGAACWAEYFLDFFAENGYRAIAVSLRGHGSSWGGDRLYTFGLNDYVNDLASVIASIDKEPVLVGHSMGGLIIQNYLKQPGSRAKAAVLMASAPPDGLSRTAPTMLFRYPISCLKLNMINTLPRSVWGKMVSDEEIRDIFFSRNTSIESIRRFLPMFQHESPFAIFEMTYFDVFTVRKINIPVFVMGGENDIIIPPGFVSYTASFYSTKPFILEGEGHAIMLSDEWQKAAEGIIKWFQDTNI